LGSPLKIKRSGNLSLRDSKPKKGGGVRPERGLEKNGNLSGVRKVGKVPSLKKRLEKRKSQGKSENANQAKKKKALQKDREKKMRKIIGGKTRGWRGGRPKKPNKGRGWEMCRKL